MTVSPGFRAAWVVALVLPACSGNPSSRCASISGAPERASLVASGLWQPEEAASDPFSDHRPASVDCSSIGAYPEGTAFEINTDDCNYAAFVQPSLEAIEIGDRVAISVIHQDLAALEPAEAHIAVSLGDTVLWERFIAIPNVPTPYNVEVEMDDCFPAEAPARLHLHNHGVNTWKLVSMEVLPGASE